MHTEEDRKTEGESQIKALAFKLEMLDKSISDIESQTENEEKRRAAVQKELFSANEEIQKMKATDQKKLRKVYILFLLYVRKCKQK